MKPSGIPLFLLSALLLSGVSAANSMIKEQSFQDNVALSDIVVVGQVIGDPRELVAGAASRFVTVEVSLTLKGTAAKRIEFMAETGISEMNPRCCEKGRSYLLLLDDVGEGRYMSVNGPFGARMLP